MDAQLLNFYQITELIGTSGQPAREQFREIAEDGYRLVVNLATPDSEHAIPEEGSIVTFLGMSYFNIPVPFDKPEIRHLKNFFDIMAAYREDKVWVHCEVNARVSAFMYQYLTKVQGLSAEDATSPLLERWKPRMDDVWKEVITWSAEELGISI